MVAVVVVTMVSVDVMQEQVADLVRHEVVVVVSVEDTSVTAIQTVDVVVKMSLVAVSAMGVAMVQSARCGLEGLLGNLATSFHSHKLDRFAVLTRALSRSDVIAAEVDMRVGVEVRLRLLAADWSRWLQVEAEVVHRDGPGEVLGDREAFELAVFKEAKMLLPVLVRVLQSVRGSQTSKFGARGANVERTGF